MVDLSNMFLPSEALVGLSFSFYRPEETAATSVCEISDPGMTFFVSLKAIAWVGRRVVSCGRPRSQGL